MFARHINLVSKSFFPTGKRVNIERGADGLFKCICDKSFLLPDSIRRRKQGCSGNDDNTARMNITGDALMDVSEGHMTERDESVASEGVV